MEARESRVHGVEPVAAVPEPLGGGDRAVVKPVHKGQARAHGGVRDLVGRRVVRGEQHYARAAPTFAAAELGAGEAGAGADEVEEGGARVVATAELEAPAVDGKDRRGRRRLRRRGSHRAEAKRGERFACRNPIPMCSISLS